MQAKDVMTATVVTVLPDTTIREIAKLLVECRISAVPVVDPDGRLLGIVSEGDLISHHGSTADRAWWLSLLARPEERAIAYIKSHGGIAGDVMTRDVISAAAESTLEEVAELLETHHIKRVPVLRDGKLCGIVSRADLLHGLIARQAASAVSVSDSTVKTAVEAALLDAGVRPELLSVVVSGGVVHLWGTAESAATRRAAHLAAEGVPGVKGVRDEIRVLPPDARKVVWD